MITLRELYNEGMKRLETAGVTEAKTDAWILLEYVTGISRASFYADLGRQAAGDQVEKYLSCIEERGRRIPVQHITGEQEFMGLTFEVNEHVLIPRQDTEILVECVEGILRPGMKVLDLCTGSGCILISLLVHGRNKGVCEEESMGIDLSEEALLTARRNVKRHFLHVPMIQSDLFEKVDGTFDIIVSNPPYIKTSEIEKLELEVKQHDPYLALDGKEDGFYFYREIIKNSQSHLNPKGHLYFEIGFDQAAGVSELMKEQGFTEITVKKDLTGFDRVVWGVYNNAEK